MREPPRILVVDDNPANLEILETRLARQGYEVVTAKDGDQALVAAREQAPDLILLDVMMPGKDGIEVCRELKSDPGLPFMPVILVTGLNHPPSFAGSRFEQRRTVFQKPIDFVQLSHRLRDFLGPVSQSTGLGPERISELTDNPPALPCSPQTTAC